MPTVTYLSCSLLFQVAYVVLSLCVGVLCELKFAQEEACTGILGAVKGESAILFGKVFLWVLVVVFTGCAQRHHGRARSRGYLRFYREMHGLKYLPINVHSTGRTALFNCTCRYFPTRWRQCVKKNISVCPGNVLLLLVLAAPLSPTVHTYMLLSILGLELLVALPCLFYYTGKHNFLRILKFQKKKSPVAEFVGLNCWSQCSLVVREFSSSAAARMAQRYHSNFYEDTPCRCTQADTQPPTPSESIRITIPALPFSGSAA